MVVIGMLSPKNLPTKSAGVLLWNHVFAFNVLLDVTGLTFIHTINTLPFSTTKVDHLGFNDPLKLNCFFNIYKNIFLVGEVY